MNARKLLESVRAGRSTSHVLLELALCETFKGPRGGEYEDAELTRPVRHTDHHAQVAQHSAVAKEHADKIQHPELKRLVQAHIEGGKSLSSRDIDKYQTDFYSDSSDPTATPGTLSHHSHNDKMNAAAALHHQWAASEHRKATTGKLDWARRDKARAAEASRFAELATSKSHMPEYRPRA